VSSTSDLTAKEFYQSVTGEERGLVSRVFKTPLAKLAKSDEETFMEALVFLDLHRSREPDAAGVAHRMTVAQLEDYFPDPPAKDDDAADEGGDAAGEA
jgi:hypothetical protein